MCSNSGFRYYGNLLDRWHVVLSDLWMYVVMDQMENSYHSPPFDWHELFVLLLGSLFVSKKMGVVKWWIHPDLKWASGTWKNRIWKGWLKSKRLVPIRFGCHNKVLCHHVFCLLHRIYKGAYIFLFVISKLRKGVRFTTLFLAGIVCSTLWFWSIWTYGLAMLTLHDTGRLQLEY